MPSSVSSFASLYSWGATFFFLLLLLLSLNKHNSMFFFPDVWEFGYMLYHMWHTLVSSWTLNMWALVFVHIKRFMSCSSFPIEPKMLQPLNPQQVEANSCPSAEGFSLLKKSFSLHCRVVHVQDEGLNQRDASIQTIDFLRNFFL